MRPGAKVTATASRSAGVSCASEKAAQILREEMEGCVHYAVPLSTDVHTGKNWLEAH